MNCLTAEYLTLPSTIDDLKQKIRDLQSYKLPDGLSDRKASVLVAFCEHEDGKMSLLYTLRSSRLKSHPGQVAFPGGKADLADLSPIDTALRETEEEIGIPRSAIEIWGEFVALPSKNFEMIVTPVIGLIRNFDHLTLKLNEFEVEEVFTVPLENLCDRQYFGFNQFKNGFTMPVYLGGKHKIWGITATFTHLILSSLFSEDYYSCKVEMLSERSRFSKSKL